MVKCASKRDILILVTLPYVFVMWLQKCLDHIVSLLVLQCFAMLQSKQVLKGFSFNEKCQNEAWFF